MRYQLPPTYRLLAAYHPLLSRDCCALQYRARANGALDARLVAEGFATLEDAKRGTEALNTINGGF